MSWGRGSTRAWRTVRAQVLKRDPTCQLQLAGCTHTSLEVDHIVRPADGGTDHPTNLRGLCPPCHAQVTKAQAAAGRARARTSRARTTEPHPGALSHRTHRGGGMSP